MGDSRDRTGREAGLTLLEVVLALAVLAILGATFTTAMLGNLRHTTNAGQRTQAAQVLNYLGRRVAGGDTVVMPTVGDSLAWNYGELAAAFPDIDRTAGFSNPDLYRVEVSASTTVSVTGATLVQYDLAVCFERQDGETCVRGATLGAPTNAASGSAPPLPGIN